MTKVAGIILLVESINDSVEFYEKLGFIVKKQIPGTATTLNLGGFWLELLHKSKVITEAYKDDIENPKKGAGLYLQIQLKNIDIFYDNIVSHGILPLERPKNYPWNQKEFIVLDPDGYKIAFFSKAN